MADGSLNQRGFRDALGCFATGVTVVTCATDQGPLAMTANSFASVSMEPALVLWSPAKSSRRHDLFAATQYSAIHVLAQEDAPLASAFATDGFDFGHCAWEADVNGTPQITSALARFDCVAHAAHDGGDHTILVAKVMGFVARAGTPLIFAQGRYGTLQESS